MCGPSPCDGSVSGELHDANEPPSSAHWKPAPPSFDVNVNVGVASLVGPLGPLLIVVSGSTVSTVQVREAGLPSVLPAASVARTWNVCEPCARPV